MIFGMEPGQFAAIVALFFIGTTVLVPVLAFSARIALKPVIEALAKLRQASTDATLQDRRIALLEAEVHTLTSAVQQFTEAEEFRRQLGTSAPAQVEHRA
jgi:hypothetical protein